jgi:aminopeptidase N
LQTSDAFQAESLDDREAYRRALSHAGHELIHLWGVRSAEAYVSRFLDEGITQYLEALLLRKEIGEEAYWKRLNDYRSGFLAGGEAAASVPLADAGQHEMIRDELSRGKGPWLMCVLHHVLGEPLLPALKVFFDRYRESGATLEDFEAAISRAAARDLTLFFQEWLWGTRSSVYLAQETPGPELAGELAAYYASLAENRE